MNKIVCSLYLKSKHMLISIKQCNQLHLMDDVWYQGERCFLNNGTGYDIDGNHLWSILKKDLNENGTRDGWDVKDSEIKKMFNEVLRDVAEEIGHTPGICRKNYLLPEIEKAWYEGKEIPKNITDHLIIKPVKWIDQVLEIALKSKPRIMKTKSAKKKHKK